MTGIGQRIRDARSKLGWSQNELASRAGVKQPTLQRIEAGLRRDPSIRTIAALAAALGLTIDALLGISPPERSQTQAARVASDAIEDLARHVSDIEARFERRLSALEGHERVQKIRRVT